MARQPADIEEAVVIVGLEAVAVSVEDTALQANPTWHQVDLSRYANLAIGRQRPCHPRPIQKQQIAGRAKKILAERGFKHARLQRQPVRYREGKPRIDQHGVSSEFSLHEDARVGDGALSRRRAR